MKPAIIVHGGAGPLHPEDDAPELNAGTGACLNIDGAVALDASIMDGSTLSAGAVALVDCVKNPIRLARKVMEATGPSPIPAPARSVPWPSTRTATSQRRRLPEA